MWHRPKGYFYLDSSSGSGVPSNVPRIIKNLVPLALSIKSFRNMLNLDVPKQANGFDCGMFVIAYMDAIIKRCIQLGSVEDLA